MRVGKRGPRGVKRREAARVAAAAATLAGIPRRGPGRPKGSKNKVKHAAPTVESPETVDDPWTTVRRMVERTGASLDEVLGLPEIPASCFEDPVIMAQLRDTVERAQLVFRLNVRGALAQKGIENLSVTALLGLARNIPGLEFDQQNVQGLNAPEVAGLEIKIDELLERLSKKRNAARSLEHREDADAVLDRPLAPSRVS
jgi:hypothetical protein